MNAHAACGLVVASAVGLAACAPDRSIAPGDLCLVALEDEVYAHACQHGEHGPYEEVSARMEAAAATTAVSGAQRVLAVALPGLADDDLRSYLRYRPTRDGQHAIFSGIDGVGVPIAMWDDGELLDATPIVPVADDRACGPLTWVTGFVLQSGRDYLIEIGPTRTTEVFLFIEHVETFGVQDWGAACETLIGIGAALGVLLAAANARSDDCTETGVGELGFPLVEHSCFHTEFGPFQAVVATAGEVPTAATANVDHVHTHYTVTLTAGGANVVTYQPVRAGNWVVFGDDAPRLRLVDELGATPPIRFVQEPVACAGLARGQVYTLEAFHRYAIVFEPSAASRTILVLEKISDFVTQYGLDADGDQFGGSDELISTPCVPPPGYLDSIDDCDDAVPTIYPGAVEQCDGVDDDCDGVSDEGACTVTGGGCDATAGGAPWLAVAIAIAVVLLRRLGGRRSRRRRVPAALAIAIAVVVAGPRLAWAERCEHLGPTIVDHTCLHARLGPFKDSTAGALASPASEHVDDVHTLHRIALPPASVDDRAGWVTYRPERSGDWAIYLGVDVPITLRDAAGTEVPWIHDDQVPGCPFFARVRMAELEGGRTYRVELGPTTATRVGVALEYVDDFVVLYGRDADRDGFGDPDQVAVSACVEPVGYVANDRDCDDRDPAISPAASERCDPGDSNCNGSDDDVGLPCSVGLGACAAIGTSACPTDGELARCDAVATLPADEICDGRDGDCDGDADLAAAGLCADAAAPRCVGDSRGGRACGCEVDADCGGPGSGRLCRLDGLEQRCVDGCVEGFGRNSCAEGERCTSRDPTAPGTCVEAPAPEQGASGCCQRAPRADLGGLLVVLVGLSLRRLRRRRGALP